MDITYIGHSCFKIKGKNHTLVIDPYDPSKTGYRLPKIICDVVLCTHQHGDHNYIQGVSDYKIVIDTAGEYEIAGTFVYGFSTFHDEQKGEERGENIVFQIEIDGISILHLGDLGHELSKDTLEKITDVDVLMIPVGGVYTIDAKKAAKIISSIEPSIVVPMHYQIQELTGLSQKIDDLKPFIEEMGLTESSVKKFDKLSISSKSDVPEETEVYILSPQH